MRNLLTATLAVAALSLAPDAVNAQFSRIAGTGCSGVRHSLSVTGRAQIGTRSGLTVRCPSRTEQPIMFAGVALAQNIPVPPPVVCRTTPCNLALSALLVARGPAGGSAGIVVAIPNNPALVGAVLRFQTACLNPTRLCVTLGLAVDMRVQR